MLQHPSIFSAASSNHTFNLGHHPSSAASSLDDNPYDIPLSAASSAAAPLSFDLHHASASSSSSLRASAAALKALNAGLIDSDNDYCAKEKEKENAAPFSSFISSSSSAPSFGFGALTLAAAAQPTATASSLFPSSSAAAVQQPRPQLQRFGGSAPRQLTPDNFFSSPVGQSFTRKEPPSKPMSKLLLLLSKLAKAGIISQQEKTQIKREVLSNNANLLQVLQKYEQQAQSFDSLLRAASIGEKTAASPFSSSPFPQVQQLQQSFASELQQPQQVGVPQQQEMIICVGFPGSGKSYVFLLFFLLLYLPSSLVSSGPNKRTNTHRTYVIKNLEPKGYVRVNRDTLQTAKRCLDLCSSSLAAGKSVVIDNTNPSREARKPYLDLARQHNVPCRCLHFLTEENTARRLNQFRHRSSGGKVACVPPMAYTIFRTKFEPPSVTEGFTEVRPIEHQPRFESPADRALFESCSFV
ncbi:DNA 3'phosphatase [Balamuthia mandrillaris]